MMPSTTASPVNVRLPEGVSAARAAAKAVDLGHLPEWDLSDLYSGLEAPEFAADMARAEEMCRGFSNRYAGRIAELAAAESASERLAEAVKAYEGIEDLLGKLAREHSKRIDASRRRQFGHKLKMDLFENLNMMLDEESVNE